MEFVKVMNEKKRMCKFNKGVCNECVISTRNNGKNLNCTNLVQNYPQEAEKLIMNWAITHPIKTNLDVFCETFGIKKEDIDSEKVDCTIFKCKAGKCTECAFYKFWEKEYKK